MLFAKFSDRPTEDSPSTFVEALKECDKDLYPNIFTLLQIGATLPVTSCQCERSASSLRRLHNYLRCSMTQERLSSLALMHIHYNFKVDLQKVVSIFANSNARKLELGSLP